jgi:iron complex transport system ATP-binding protein
LEKDSQYPKMVDTLLIFNNVSYSYTNGRDFSFEDVNINIPQKTITSILGRNGAGKTTLLLLMLGFLKPTQGSVNYCPERIKNYTSRGRKSIAYLPQIETAPEKITVMEYLLMGRTPYIAPFFMPGDRDSELVKKYAKIVEVDHLLRYQLGKISGGELQRVRIGRALVQESELILLDEPITHLDLNAKYSMMKMISDLRSLGKTIVFTTHDPAEALNIADNALIINRDQQINFGLTRDVLTEESLTACFSIPIKILDNKFGYACVVEETI